MSQAAEAPSILVTGFEPFDRFSANPSSQVASMLNGLSIDGHRIRGVRLPVSSASAPGALNEAIAEVHPSLILGLGLAARRLAMSIERIAINALDFPVADNDGLQAADVPIEPEGPDAFLSNLPLKRIVAAWTEAGIPGYISNSAGTYVCNQVFYCLMAQARTHGLLGGFIHLPLLPHQTTSEKEPAASMTLDQMVQAVQVALEVSIS